MVIILITISMLLLLSCIQGEENNPDIDFYKGEHPELYTVAMHSLLGQRGFSFHSGPHIFDAMIVVLEVDTFDRVLFLYFEQPNARVSSHNLLISQKSNEGYVYFIPHYNFISSEQPWTLILEALDYLPEEVEELKKLNDWNQPLDLERAMRVPIIRRKDGPTSDRAVETAYQAAITSVADGPLGGYRNIIFFITDVYGRSIYVGTGLERGHETGEGFLAVVMLFQPDGSHDPETGVMQLLDFQNYQSELREFKELNRWNQPLEE